MAIQYLIFYISVGLLMAVLLNLLNILTFRAKGKVIGYRFEVGSAEYKKYRSRADAKALLATLLGIIILILLITLQAWIVARKHVSESTATLAFGSILAIVFVLWVFYTIATMSEKMNSSNKPKSADDKNHKDSWKA